MCSAVTAGRWPARRRSSIPLSLYYSTYYRITDFPSKTSRSERQWGLGSGEQRKETEEEREEARKREIYGVSVRAGSSELLQRDNNYWNSAVPGQPPVCHCYYQAAHRYGEVPILHGGSRPVCFWLMLAADSIKVLDIVGGSAPNSPESSCSLGRAQQ